MNRSSRGACVRPASTYLTIDPDREATLSMGIYVLLLVIALMFAYLFYALFRPERF